MGRGAALAWIIAAIAWSAPVSAEVSVRIAPTPRWAQVASVDLQPSDGETARLLLDTQAYVGRNEFIMYRRTVDRALTSDDLADLIKVELRFWPAYQRLRMHVVRVHRAGRVIDLLRPGAITVARTEGEL